MYTRKYLQLALLAFAITFVFGSSFVQAQLAARAYRAPLLGQYRVGALKDRYIVVFKKQAQRSLLQDAKAQAVALGGQISFEYSTVLNGFAATLPPPALEALRQNPNVAYIDQDGVFTGGGWPARSDTRPPHDTTQPNATWGLDRVDQRDLPLNNTFIYGDTGQGVNVYVLDSGIRATHVEFEGRAQGVFNAVPDNNGTNDCHGHGTHVAGTVASKTYGVAKQASIKAVRILHCDNSGIWSEMIAGMDWTAANHVKPAVANMSIQGGSTTSADEAADRLIDSGVILVLIAGNFNSDACTNSPRSPRAITLAASTSTDSRASFSNYGSCVDLFAPGENITSVGIANDTAVAEGWSGTSMAAPHAAGAAAVYLQSHPNATMQEVHDAIVNSATTGRITDVMGSPNKLLYTRSFAPSQTIFSDTFETSTGWTVNPSGTDTATLGQWERGDPEATDSSGPKQLGTTTSGVNDLVTGRLAGTSAGAYDLDGGISSIRSPSITLPSSGSLTLTFKYYLAHANNASSTDYLRVKIVGSTTATVFERLGAATDIDAAWQTATVSLNAFAGQAVRILIEAADVSTASLLEAAIDDVEVTGEGASTPTPTITPTATPTPTPTPTPGVVTVFSDTFETSTGWTINPSGTDTATLGQWERGDPEATSDTGGAKQLGTTTSGSNDLVTGRLAGSSVGAYDLDGGITSIRSPSITMPSSGNLTLTLKYYLAHANNSSSADHLRVKIVGSTTTTVFEKLGAAANVNAGWQTATINLSSYTGQTIRILIEAADISTASLLEAAVDDVSIVKQ